MNPLQFIKNWTLPISMALGIGIHLLFAFTPQLDGFATWFLPIGQKNTPFAIWIANTYMNPLSSVGPGCYIFGKISSTLSKYGITERKDLSSKYNQIITDIIR